MEVKDKTTDVYVQKLNDQIVILKKCQKEHHVISCTKCKTFIGCDIRKNYVNAVYQSMNKGAGGGFEF